MKLIRIIIAVIVVITAIYFWVSFQIPKHICESIRYEFTDTIIISKIDTIRIIEKLKPDTLYLRVFFKDSIITKKYRNDTLILEL